MPIFAHVPLISRADKTRLSKRHGGTVRTAYRDEGIVPEGFGNFLALLGWTPADSTKEVMADKELVASFVVDNISHSNAVFDLDKLAWFNTEYIRAAPADKLLPLVRREWEVAGLKPESQEDPELLSLIDLL